MSPLEARNILGLKPEDDPQSYLADFADARERIAEMVRKAPNETLASRYQEGLIEFDRALAVVREEMDARQASASVAAPPPLPAAFQPLAPAPDPAPVVAAVLPPPLPPSAVVAVGVFTAAAGDLGPEVIESKEKPAEEIAPPAAAENVPPASMVPAPSPEEVSAAALNPEPAPVVDIPAAIEPAAPTVLPPPLPPSAFVAATAPAVLEPVPASPASVEIEPVAEEAAPVAASEPFAVESPPLAASMTLPPPLPPVAGVITTLEPEPPTEPSVAEVDSVPEAVSQDLSPVVGETASPFVAPPVEPEAVAPSAAGEPSPAAEETPVAEASNVIPPADTASEAAEVPAAPSPLSFVVPVRIPAAAKAPEEPSKPAGLEPVAQDSRPSSAPAILPPPLLPSSFLAATTSPVREDYSVAPESLPIGATSTTPPVVEKVEPSLPPGAKAASESGKGPATDSPAPLELPAWLSALRVPAASAPEISTPAEPVTPSAQETELTATPAVEKAKLLPFETPLLARRGEAAPEPSVNPQPEAASEPAAAKPETPPAAEHAPELAMTGNQALPRFLEPLQVEAKASASPATADAVEKSGDEEFEEKPRSSKGLVATLVVLLALAGAGGWGWKLYNESQALTRQSRLTFLETLGAKMIEARQWPEAANAYDEIEKLKGDHGIVERGRQNIEAGKEDEQNQFVGYWAGEALAAFEAGRSEDAEEAARKVLERYPNETETAALLAKIEQAKVTKIVEGLKKAIRDSMQLHQWEAAEASARELTSRYPEEAEGYSLLSEIREDRDREKRNRARAADLFSAAKLKDQGRFDREAMEWLREAQSLDPEDKSIAALYEKMASYTRTVHVPGDFPDLKKALESCGDRDRIVLGEGTWPGGLVIGKGVSLEGAGPDKTIIEVDAKESAAATFGPAAKGARISGIAFRQTSFDNGVNRFPALLVRGGELAASDCRFENASGHGAAVIDGGSLTAKRCTFANNGWDGVAAQGDGSRLALEECESTANYGHGYDLWNGAAGSLRACQASQNSRNGILVDTTAKDVLVEENELRGNREYGIVISAAASGKVRANTCRENLLGGLVMRAAAGQLAVENNRAEKNNGPGLVLEQGLTPANYTSNAATANGGGKDTMANVDFSAAQ